MAGVKRTRESYGSRPGGPKPKPKPRTEKQQPVIEDGPFIPMFLKFRDELDEHHDRRERVIKASRDITALSKKIIFTLQRAAGNAIPSPLGESIVADIHGYEAQIRELLQGIGPDLQGLNGYRYARQITGGLQEYVEALSFRHYIVTGQLMGLEDAAGYVSGEKELDAPPPPEPEDEMDVDVEGEVAKDAGEGGSGGVKLDVAADGAKSVKTHRLDSPSRKQDTTESTTTTTTTAENTTTTATDSISLTTSDFILGLFDLVGEIMRFAITSIARTPLSGPHGAKSVPDIPILKHMRQIRAGFESLDTARDPFGKDIDKKMRVMRECVEKVEIAMYGRIVRGSERPEGWIMTGDDTGWSGGGDED